MINGRLAKSLLVLILCVCAMQANASTGPWGSDGPLSARLISAEGTVTGQSNLLLGLHLRLEDGWKTYWRTPGAAGAAPELELSNAALEPDPELFWPAPERFNLLGLQSYGYSKEVVLPIRYQLNSSLSDLSLDGRAKVFACKEICLPLAVNVQIDIGKNDFDWESQRLINKFLSRVPKQLPTAEPGPIFLKDNDGLYFSMRLEKAASNADIFLENVDVHDWPDPIVTVDQGIVRAWWERKAGTNSEDLNRAIRFTYVDDFQSYEAEAELKMESRPIKNEGHWYLSILAMAWFGGLILNVMPCVLPVLSMKLLKMTEMRGLSERTVRTHMGFTIIGIMTVFWLLAAVLALLKTAGAFVGWGVQFQNPYFLLFLFLLMIMFSANLLGWFEFKLPIAFQTNLAYAGSDESSPKISSFIQGGTATLLATPCSAPFLGTAIAFALSRNWLDILFIFTAVGVGLATPYILLILWPRSLSILPKPGPWMVWVKRVLALGMLLASVWILWLINNHFDQSSTVIIFAIGILWFFLWAPSVNPWRSYAKIFLVLTLMLFPLLSQKSNDQTGDTSVKFDPKQIESLVGQGKSVFVDITADWCITCKYNKTFVLDTNEVQRIFDTNKVVFMQGDWTLPNDDIQQYLLLHDRSGIPFNILYSPNYPQGRLLPELLSLDVIRNAFESLQLDNTQLNIDGISQE